MLSRQQVVELDERSLHPPEDPDELILVASNRSEEAVEDVMSRWERGRVGQSQMDCCDRTETSHAFERSIGVTH